MTSSLTIRPLTAADEPRWRDLWQGYLTFYEASVPERVTAHTFRQLIGEGGHTGLLACTDDGTIIGLTHYLMHASTWTDTSYCYLEDLFVDPAGRGQGAGRALILAVKEAADAASCTRLYWSTQETNATARALYDKVARNAGFIQYRMP